MSFSLPKKWRSRVLSTAALVLATVAPASAQVTVDNTINVLLTVGNPGAGGEAIVPVYDASGSDKLVVVVSSEHAFGTGSGLTIDGMEYNGRTMIEAVEESTLPGTTALYYLDDPGPAGEIRIYCGNKNGGLATVYALSGTAPGVAATGQSTIDTVDVTTTANNSLVIAALMDGGQFSNGNGAVAPTIMPPMTFVHSNTWGNAWGAHGCGYQMVATAGLATSSFGTGGPLRLRTVTAAFSPGGPGMNYCISNANSTGGPALIHATGSSSVAANNLTLHSEPVPNQPGLFFYGSMQVQLPFGHGLLCVSGGLNLFYPPVLGVLNQATQAVDYSILPASGQISAGSTWNFQYWYRDPAAGAPAFNTSDGLAITFTP